MRRLLVHVEGPTERNFVNELLTPHLIHHGYTQVSARIIGNARRNTHRGGNRTWPEVRRDILAHLQQDPGCVVTTMVDFYGMPTKWPGRADAAGRTAGDKAVQVEQALAADIGRQSGRSFDARRFVPFVVVHEFEGLLFSDCRRFAAGIGRPDLTPRFQDIRNQFANPEEINDSPRTAPSKRVQAIVPDYQKPLFGALAAIEIGLGAIRTACPHFRNWLDRLEHLPLDPNLATE